MACAVADVAMLESHRAADEVPLCIQEILGDEQHKWLSAVRSLKNRTIGSRRRKQQALDCNVLPRLLQFVSSDDQSNANDVCGECSMLQCESGIVLGSLAKGDAQHVRLLVDGGAIQALTFALDTEDLQVLEASLKCLKSLFQHESTPIDLLYSPTMGHDGADANRHSFQTPTLIERLIRAQPHSFVCQLCVTDIMHRCCQTREQQATLTSYGAVHVANALIVSANQDVRSNALKLLAALTYDNRDNCCDLQLIKDLLVDCMRRDQSKEIQFSAAQCLTNMYRCGLFSASDPLIRNKVMPCVVRMCHQECSSAMRTQALNTLAYLTENDVRLQKLTAENNHCLRTISDCLRLATAAHDDKRHYATIVPLSQQQPHIAAADGDLPNPEKLECAALSALASLSLNDEDIRRKIGQELPLFESVLRSAMEPNANRAHVLAVCKCLHALSRSVEQLRITFQEKLIWKTLLQICEHWPKATDEQDVQLVAVASAIIANLMVSFSPCQSALIEANAIDVFASMSLSSNPSLTLNAVWALMNVTCRASEKLKQNVMRAFGIEKFQSLLETTARQSPIIPRLLGLLRNILSECTLDGGDMRDVSTDHVDKIVNQCGAQIVDVVKRVLCGEYSVDNKELALQVASNIAASDCKHYLLADNAVMQYLIDVLKTDETPTSVLIYAVSTVANLAWNDDPGYSERQEQLRILGADKHLIRLQNTNDSDLEEKVKLALDNL